MKIIAKLHSAARRYCENRHSYWVNEYNKICNAGRDRIGKSYTKEALSIFPRYNILAAILEDIERFVPEDFENLEEAYSLINYAVSTADSIFTKPPHGSIEKRVMNEERQLMAQYLDKIVETSFEDIELMPFRKVLSEKESNATWKNINRIWGIKKGYWYPLTDKKTANVESFKDSYFEQNVSVDSLVKALLTQGIKRFWELREHGANYEMESKLFEPYYNGAEGFWTSSSFEWIMYCSHESSVTVGGWLLNEIKKIWTDCEKHLWTSPFFE